MSRPPVRPQLNLCTVTLDLPWEVAEALAEHGTALIAAIQDAVRARKEDAAQAAVRKVEVDRQCDQNRVDWAAMAVRCEVEISRRSNSGGQRQSIIRQLAAEWKVTPAFLSAICRVFGREARQEGLERRKGEIIRLYFLGKANWEIAAEIKLSPQTVASVLTAEKDTIKALRADPVQLERLRMAGGVQ